MPYLHHFNIVSCDFYGKNLVGLGRFELPTSAMSRNHQITHKTLICILFNPVQQRNQREHRTLTKSTT